MQTAGLQWFFSEEKLAWPYTKDSRKKQLRSLFHHPWALHLHYRWRTSQTAPAVTCLSPGSVLGKGSSLLSRADAAPRSAWLDVAGARQALLAPCPCYQKRALIQSRRQGPIWKRGKRWSTASKPSWTGAALVRTIRVPAVHLPSRQVLAQAQVLPRKQLLSLSSYCDSCTIESWDYRHEEFFEVEIKKWRKNIEIFFFLQLP